MYVWEMLEVVYACTDLAIRTVYFCTSRWEEVSCLFHMIQKLPCLGATYIPRDYAVVPEYLRGEGDPEIQTVGYVVALLHRRPKERCDEAKVRRRWRSWPHNLACLPPRPQNGSRSC